MGTLDYVKRMKKFLKNTFIYILPIILIGWSAELLLRNIPNDYQIKKQYLDHNAESIEVLYLGSSHAFHGINPNHCTVNSYNAALSSQSIDYDYAILKKYESQFNHLKYIVIPISYFTLYSRLESSIEASLVKNYVIYYNINTSNKFTNHFEVLSSKPFALFKRLYSYYIQRNTRRCAELGWGMNNDLRSDTDLLRSGKAAAFRHSGNINEYYELNVQVVKDIIEWAKSKDIKVILYTPPAYKSYTNELDSIQLNQTLITMKRIDDQYENAAYYNLLTDSAFVANDYYDADHLNSAGAKKLTKLLDGVVTKEIDHVIK